MEKNILPAGTNTPAGYIIVEDEDRGAAVLRRIVDEHMPMLAFLGRAAGVKEAVQLIEEKQPQLVFLDVELRDGSGLDVLRRFGHRTFKVIFTTAHDHYALPAIKFSAIDFLLKPISISEVKTAVEKAFDQPQHERLDNLQQLNNTSSLQRLALPTSEGYLFVDMNQVLYVSAEGSYSVFHLAGQKKHMVSRSLKEYEDLLSPFGFFRIHHSHIVQLSQIEKYVKGSGGYVVMKDGTPLDVSARRKEEFLKRLKAI